MKETALIQHSRCGISSTDTSSAESNRTMNRTLERFPILQTRETLLG